MSGGVDSSVAAALTVEAGYDCIGVTMKLYDEGSAFHTAFSILPMISEKRSSVVLLRHIKGEIPPIPASTAIGL